MSLRPLKSIAAIIRHGSDQMVSFQYVCGTIRTFTSTERDSLIASFLDGVRGSGNRDVHVRASTLERRKRLGPLNIALEEEVKN